MKLKEIAQNQIKIDNHNKKVLTSVKKTTDNVVMNERKKEQAINIYNSLSSGEKEIFKQEVLKRKAKENFADYLRYVYGYKLTKFQEFLAKVCQTAVERVEKGQKIRIILSVPPRHGKSETITKTLPSWFVGRNPDKRAILTAYNADLAEKFEDSNRQKTREFGKDIFGIEISPSQDNKTLYEIKDHSGFVMGVGIGGGITGNGGELIIIDDPYKNSVEANSSSTRDMIENTFRDSVYTRLQGRGNALIIIQTRWHEEDLAGVMAKEHDDWIVINIPAVCTTDEKRDALHRQLGQTLCPELGFDSQWAIETEKSVGEKVWEALYQGHPSIEGGEIFTRDMIRFYKKADLPTNFEEQTISCDLTFGGTRKTNDYVAIQVWGRVGANHYLLKRIKKRMNFNEMCDSIKSVSNAYPQAIKKIVEKKANGQAVIDSLNSIVGGFVPYDPKCESKIGRANGITPLLVAGNVWLPDKSVDSTIDVMVEEMMKFPNSEHDDEVDAMTQYLTTWKYDGCGRIATDNTYKIISNVWRGIKI